MHGAHTDRNSRQTRRGRSNNGLLHSVRVQNVWLQVRAEPAQSSQQAESVNLDLGKDPNRNAAAAQTLSKQTIIEKDGHDIVTQPMLGHGQVKDHGLGAAPKIARGQMQNLHRLCRMASAASDCCSGDGAHNVLCSLCGIPAF